MHRDAETEMSRRAALVAAIACVTVLVAAQNAAAACAARGATVVARSGEAIVVAQRLEGGARAYVGCVRATGARTELGRAGSGFGFAKRLRGISVAGTKVAWGVTLYGREGVEASRLRIRDLRRPGHGRRLDFGVEPVVETAVDASGRVAARTATTLVAVARRGTRRVLDVGVPGSIGDLAVRDGTVRWRHGERTLSAPVHLPWGACRPRRDGAVLAVGDRAVLQYRAGAGRRVAVLGCLRDGEGFTPLGEQEGAAAGTMAAAIVRGPEGRRIRVVDLAGDGVVQEVPILDPTFEWTLGADGTVVLSAGGRVTVHRPGAEEVAVGTAIRPGGLVVDEVLGRVAWRGGSAPLP